MLVSSKLDLAETAFRNQSLSVKILELMEFAPFYNASKLIVVAIFIVI